MDKAYSDGRHVNFQPRFREANGGFGCLRSLTSRCKVILGDDFGTPFFRSVGYKKETCNANSSFCSLTTTTLLLKTYRNHLCITMPWFHHDTDEAQAYNEVRQHVSGILRR